MTYGILNLIAIFHDLKRGIQPRKALIFKNFDQWKWQLKYLYDYTIGCHIKHALDFLFALICYLVIFPMTFHEASVWRLGWVSKVVAFNLMSEFLVYGFWHWVTYMSEVSKGPLKDIKFNPKNQYEENEKNAVGFIFSSSGNLQREVLYTTLGWLQSSAYQCVMMWLWASGRVPYYLDFWRYPIYSLVYLLFISYFREFHFYWVHRMMHPWKKITYGLAEGDIGAFLYRHFHSLHHKSYNPGPWAGLSMHPVEHFFYYTCTLLPLFIQAHPIHFLYAKFHADISPVGGHDGYNSPAGGSTYHYLHHSRYECNYGVPLINFDKLFGTFMDYEKVKDTLEERKKGDKGKND
jgi:sterol desaturase/sphingolipid hydroxylase (fatty acid hydroxylase superfamily)